MSPSSMRDHIGGLAILLFLQNNNVTASKLQTRLDTPISKKHHIVSFPNLFSIENGIKN